MNEVYLALRAVTSQAYNYFEPTKAKQIYYRQHHEYIELIAKAYVASTYNEALFKSDITRRFFLQFVKSEGILLANQSYAVLLQNNTNGNDFTRLGENLE